MRPFQTFRTTPLLVIAVAVLAVLNLVLLGVVWTRVTTEPPPAAATTDPGMDAWLLELRQEIEQGEWRPERRRALLERLREMEAAGDLRRSPLERARPPFGDASPGRPFNRPGGSERSALPDAAGPAVRGLDRRLGLDSLQLQEVRTLRSRHLEQTRKLESAIRRQRLGLLQGRLQAVQRDGATPPDSDLAAQSARYDSVAAYMIRLEQLNMQHIVDIRALLTENQREVYDRSVARLFTNP